MGGRFQEIVFLTILLVAQKLGGVCAGAFAPNGRMLGFVFGMTGVRDGVNVERGHVDDLTVRTKVLTAPRRGVVAA